MTDSTQALGFIAAACTTLSFVPQVWQVWRSRDTRAISFGMYTLFVLGVALWLAYGYLLGSWPIVIANAVTLVLAGTVWLLKWRWG